MMVVMMLMMKIMLALVMINIIVMLMVILMMMMIRRRIRKMCVLKGAFRITVCNYVVSKFKGFTYFGTQVLHRICGPFF